MCQIKGVVGIFSIEDQRTYDWVIQFLLSSSAVTDVRPVYIPRDFSNLSHEIHQCTFAILYHTKNRGRLNVTGVTDSLYDEELELLHQILGKNNVIVVMDDVEDSSDDVKSQILESQPNIRLWAQDLFLFSSQEKKDQKQITNLIKAHNRRLPRKKLSENYKIVLIVILMFIFLVLLLIVVELSIYAERNNFNNQSTTVSPGNVTRNQ